MGMVMLAPFASFTSFTSFANLVNLVNGAQLPQGSAWVWLILLGVVHTGLMYILMYGAIHKLPTYLQGSLSFIYPVVAILVDYLAYNHRLHPLQLIGATTILIAAAAGINLGWSWRRKAV